MSVPNVVSVKAKNCNPLILKAKGLKILSKSKVWLLPRVLKLKLKRFAQF